MQPETLPTTRPLPTSWRRMFDRCSKLINQYTCWKQSETKKKHAKKLHQNIPLTSQSGSLNPDGSSRWWWRCPTWWERPSFPASRSWPVGSPQICKQKHQWITVACGQSGSTVRRGYHARGELQQQQQLGRRKERGTYSQTLERTDGILGAEEEGKKQDRGLRSMKSKKARLFWFPKKLAQSIGSKIETQNDGSRRKSESNKNMCVRELLISVQKHRTFAVFLWSLAWGSGRAISLNVFFWEGNL